MNVKRQLTFLLAVFILPLLAFGGRQPEIHFNPEDLYIYMKPMPIKGIIMD
jgi:hypothetical protein